MTLKSLLFVLAVLVAAVSLTAQDVERALPKEWDGLVYGGRFMDLFLPMPAIGELTSHTWGANGVLPRYTNYGLENKEWSYWGGNIIKGDDGKFHQFVCRWLEDSPKGHMEWPNSFVAHAVSDNSLGPFKVVKTVGKGHNPEIYKMNDGRYVLSVNGGYYLSGSLNGPWTFNKDEYDQRDRPIFDHIANQTYAMRPDGSYLMVGRGGEIAVSQSGLPPFEQINSKSIYPPYEGTYEDPVVWRDHVQYHLIVNDWSGRIAYYLRSPDGINWKLDPGEAYKPGIAVLEHGKVEEWYKFERMKVLQDNYGRAYQANFAVADTIKKQDLGNDNHSSKNIGIPLTIGRLIEIMDTALINENTKTIRLKIKSEPGFNAQKDMDIKSLRFGTSEEVNFGRGCKMLKTQKSENDLIVLFEGKGNGLKPDDFAAKLLGRTKEGKLLFGFASLPWYNYTLPVLSCRFPELMLNGNQLKVKVEVSNFGIVVSGPEKIEISYLKNGEWTPMVTGQVPTLEPYAKTSLTLYGKKFANNDEVAKVKVVIHQNRQGGDELIGNVVIR